jgi:hypothetical protein
LLNHFVVVYCVERVPAEYAGIVDQDVQYNAIEFFRKPGNAAIFRHIDAVNNAYTEFTQFRTAVSANADYIIAARVVLAAKFEANAAIASCNEYLCHGVSYFVSARARVVVSR